MNSLEFDGVQIPYRHLVLRPLLRLLSSELEADLSLKSPVHLSAFHLSSNINKDQEVGNVGRSSHGGQVIGDKLASFT